MYSMKMKKYKRAARTILTQKVGYGLANELKRKGFWVRTVLDKPQAADVLLRNHTVDMMDKRRIECLLVVLDNSDFVGGEEALDWDDESEDANVAGITHASDADCIKNGNNGAWWKLESFHSEATS
ncbi:hypothetical protein CUMW_241120 [Citrus unshiu]|uniref:Uncharacterized protein n=1 Tax=Citrus unshiu TaxID=55188 RepID=A0A2H5QLF1_CITUN|nr:hypothetical protein CUMW_241120 [Citrus unshiu]